MQEQVLTIKIRVSHNWIEPANWDWQTLLDLGAGESVSILAIGPVFEGDDYDDGEG